MEHIRAIVTVGLVFGTIALAGCKSKQQVAAQLQAEYKTAYAQYYKDCIAPAYGGANAGPTHLKRYMQSAALNLRWGYDKSPAVFF